MIRTKFRLLGSLALAGGLALLAASSVAAHVVKQAGPYTIEIGWQHEPAYVGESNGVQVIIHDASGKPVTDLASSDLQVVVSAGGQQSSPLTFDPGFDPIEMSGPLGEYDAPIQPTAPGDYTFHLTGSIRGQAVDVTVSSGPATFDTVKGTADLQFPTKLPTIAEIAMRLDRVDSRISALATSSGPTQASVDAAAKQASDAASAADRALLIGGGLGLGGLVVGVIGVVLARRASRRTGA